MATRITQREYLTTDERRLLESCYRCECNGCSLRRDAIAKALRIIDGDSGIMTEAALRLARNIPAEHSCGSGCLRCEAVKRGLL